jgi:hypothetical protein
MTVTLRQETAAGATTKGSALTYAELDNNFVHLLRQGSVTVRADSGADQTLGEADKDSILNFVGGTNATTTISSDSAGETVITVASTDTGILSVVEDTTPQLGGSLDVNGNKIVSVSNGDIDIEPNGTGNVLLGNLTFDADQTVGAGQDNYVLTYDNGTGLISLEVAAAGGLANIVEDTTPQLGGDLDVNGNNIDFGDSATPGTDDTLVFGAAGNVHMYYSAAEAFRIVGNTTGAITIENEGAIYLMDTTSGISLTSNVGALTLQYQGGNRLTTTSGGITVDAATTFFSGNLVSDVQLRQYKEEVHSLGTTSGTITPNVANGNVQKITLNGNLTFSAFTSPEAGQSLTLIIDTNGTGRTLTSTMLFAGGTKTLSTTDTVDIMSVFYDGTTYYASLSTNFS